MVQLHWRSIWSLWQEMFLFPLLRDFAYMLPKKGSLGVILNSTVDGVPGDASGQEYLCSSVSGEMFDLFFRSRPNHHHPCFYNFQSVFLQCALHGIALKDQPNAVAD